MPADIDELDADEAEEEEEMEDQETGPQDEEDAEDAEDADNGDCVSASLVSDLQRRLVRADASAEAAPPLGGMDATRLSGGRGKTRVQDLLSVLPGAKAKLRQELHSMSQRHKVAPAPQRQLEAKSERIASYERSRKELGRWFGFVESNRLAESREFPSEPAGSLRPQSAAEYQLRVRRDAAAAAARGAAGEADDLESRLYSRLYAPTAQSATADAAELNSDAVQERLVARRRLVARQHYLEAKLKRQARIKSKSYRRHARKAKLKQEVAELSALKESDPEAFSAKLQELERDRAEERISQRHRAGGRFARRQRLRAKFDDTAKQAVQDMIQVGKQLVDKPPERSDEEQEEEEEEAAAAAKEAAEAAATEVAAEVAAEWEAAGDDSDDGDGGDDDVRVPARLRAQPEAQKLGAAASAAPATRTLELDLDHLPDVGDADDDLDVDERQRLVRSRADDLLAVDASASADAAEFAAEKAAVAASEQPADVDLFLAGWNSWTGAGTRAPTESQRRRFRLAAPQRRRRDARLRSAIVRERLGCTDALRRHQVKEVPFPFANAAQFEASLRQPVCRDFATPKAHKRLTQPKVTVRMGRIVEPADKEAVLRKRRRRTHANIAAKSRG